MNEIITVNGQALQNKADFDNFVTKMHNHRKQAEEKPTPEQHKGKLPMGGKMTDYIKSPYMIDELKKFCHELYNVKIVEIKDVPMPTSKLPEHWVRMSIEVLDRSTGNSYPGVGAARVRTNSDGSIVNYRHDLTAAETYCWKDAAKNMGIGADIYGRDVSDFSEEIQTMINVTLPLVLKAFGKDEAERFITKLEGLTEEQALDYLNKIKEKLQEKK